MTAAIEAPSSLSLPLAVQKTNSHVVCQRILGEGAFGVVGLLTSQTEEKKYIEMQRTDWVREIYPLPLALKKVTISSRNLYWWREIHMLRESQGSPLIVKYQFFTCSKEGPCFYLGMEYAGPQNVEEQHINYGQLATQDFVGMAFLITKVLAYLKKRNIVHADVKSTNLFFWKDGRMHPENLEEEDLLPEQMKALLREYVFKLVDFGSANQEGARLALHHEVQTPSYRGVQGILSGVVSYKNEFSSLAAILFELYCRERLMGYDDPAVRHFFSQKEGNNQICSLLKLYYSHNFTNTPSQETIAWFYAQNPERVKKYYANDPNDPRRPFTLHLPLYYGADKRKVLNTFLAHVHCFRQQKTEKLLLRACVREDSEEFAGRLLAFIDRLLNADEPPSSPEVLVADPFFVHYFWELQPSYLSRAYGLCL